VNHGAANPLPQPGPSVPAADSSPAGGLFSPTSFWNAPLRPDAPLDPNSSVYATDLLRQLATYGSWISTTSYSFPVYIVPVGQPTVPVALDKTSTDPETTDLRQAFAQVPIPPNAKPAGGTDAELIIWRQPDGWHARWGGRMDHVSSNPGYYGGPHSQWGSTATSLPGIGGLIRLSELSAGHIDHALSMAIPDARAGSFVWPAQRTDGNVSSNNAIPEGTRFRLDPNLNLDQTPMSRTVRMMAEAAQRYGIVVNNRSANISFYGEDPTPTGEDPYDGPGGYFQGESPRTLLAQFPWTHLQVLAVPPPPSP
jgi:hypothetical protein